MENSKTGFLAKYVKRPKGWVLGADFYLYLF